MPLATQQAGPPSDRIIYMKTRVDQLLVSKGICPSRTKAKELIEKGLVEVAQGIGWIKVQQASATLDEGSQLRLIDDDFLKYVSRSGHKLAGALKHLSLDPAGLFCLDLGASTGGFTDCLLQQDAAEVYCVDVGHGQLHNNILQNPKVKNFEGLNVKDIDSIPEIASKKFDLVVIDLSFISVFKILDLAIKKLKAEGQLVSLLKPQFEVGSVNIGKGGIVKSEEAVEELIENTKKWIGDFHHQDIKIIDSKIFAAELAGRDGNQEYFIYIKRN